MSRPPSEIELTAYHEAAHAVARARLRPSSDSDGATIRPRDGVLGSARSESSIQLGATEADVDAEILEYYAGHYASVYAGDSRKRSRLASACDFANVDELLTYTSTPKRNLQRRSTAFIKKNWEAIQAVGTELQKYENLDSDEIEMIIEIAGGRDDSVEALVAYRKLKHHSHA